jgi:hypothetical protein
MKKLHKISCWFFAKFFTPSFADVRLIEALMVERTHTF